MRDFNSLDPTGAPLGVALPPPRTAIHPRYHMQIFVFLKIFSERHEASAGREDSETIRNRTRAAGELHLQYIRRAASTDNGEKKLEQFYSVTFLLTLTVLDRAPSQTG